ncbi:MAG TPA: MFS transporter [Acetobacteraceae bacterium]|nr:MFS transporter [Acetobacteraceae bacterium]
MPIALLHDPAASEIEQATMRRVARRLVPLLIACYCVAYLDRVNVSFAGLTMNRDLHLSASVFGFGAGVFFVSYFLCELPSNLILNKVGARMWIARILITWGIVSGLTAAVQGEKSFYAIRFVLGAAEAGFYPGVILYITWWFPNSYRSRIIGLFQTAIPISVIVGSIISGTILSLDGTMGLAGWQWLFILEAVPSIVLGIVVARALTDRPEVANWLSPEQRNWLAGRLAAERAEREAVHHFKLGEALRSGRVLALTLVYFGNAFASYGLTIFLPQIVHRFGISYVGTGLVTAIPYVFGAFAMVAWGLHADRTGERGRHCAAACFLSFVGLASCVFLDNPVALMAAIILAQMGQSAIAPTFWPLPSAMLTGTAAAGGIALINSVGNLGGFLGPYAMGLARDATGSFGVGLLILASGMLVAGITLLLLGRDRRYLHAPGRQAAE